jgi:hypothetical protein
MKIKFGIKIEFLKITGTGNLIPKNMGDKKKLPKKTSNTPFILSVIFTLTLYLLIQTPPSKKYTIKS